MSNFHENPNSGKPRFKNYRNWQFQQTKKSSLETLGILEFVVLCEWSLRGIVGLGLNIVRKLTK